MGVEGRRTAGRAGRRARGGWYARRTQPGRASSLSWAAGRLVSWAADRHYVSKAGSGFGAHEVEASERTHRDGRPVSGSFKNSLQKCKRCP